MSEGIRPICMPKWGLSMKEGKVAGWLVGEGDSITPGDEVIDIETEKISSAVEAADAGVLRRCVAQEGEVLPIGALLGIVADESVADGDIDAFVTDFQANFVPPEDDDEDSGPATETMEIAGRQIRYLSKGEGGVPVILIHGFGGDLNNWLFNHDALAAKRAVHALDLPGHGSSAKDVGDGSIGFFADIVTGFADALGIEQAHLVGHSMGGAIALAVARAAPARVASLTLIGSAGLGSDIDGDYLEGFISAERRKDLKPHVEKLFSDPALVTRQLSQRSARLQADRRRHRRAGHHPGLLRPRRRPGGGPARCGRQRADARHLGRRRPDHPRLPCRRPAGRRGLQGARRPGPHGPDGSRHRGEPPDRRTPRLIRHGGIVPTTGRVRAGGRSPTLMCSEGLAPDARWPRRLAILRP